LKYTLNIVLYVELCIIPSIIVVVAIIALFAVKLKLRGGFLLIRYLDGVICFYYSFYSFAWNVGSGVENVFRLFKLLKRFLLNIQINDTYTSEMFLLNWISSLKIM